ncbi:MAG: RNA-directed DNA polymerase, partial [bacterium]|nr:RNA-directed DNA polymerase [bacterium]
MKKVKKLLKEKCPYHYLVFQRKDKMLKIIQDKSKKYPYFLRFDIEKYYPSINHEILLDILRKILKSRQGQKLLKTEILPFLNKIGIQNKGLPLGNYLSYVLAGIYLLPLDIKLIKLNKPFLRVQDDYLVFCKNKKE